MKKTRDLLMVLFWAQLIIPAVIYVCCEFLDVDLAFLAGTSEKARYVVSTVMILVILVPFLQVFSYVGIDESLIVQEVYTFVDVDDDVEE